MPYFCQCLSSKSSGEVKISYLCYSLGYVNDEMPLYLLRGCHNAIPDNQAAYAPTCFLRVRLEDN